MSDVPHTTMSLRAHKRARPRSDGSTVATVVRSSCRDGRVFNPAPSRSSCLASSINPLKYAGSRSSHLNLPNIARVLFRSPVTIQMMPYCDLAAIKNPQAQKRPSSLTAFFSKSDSILISHQGIVKSTMFERSLVVRHCCLASVVTIRP